MTPQELGKAIAAVYSDTLRATIRLLEGQRAAQSTQNALATLKEAAIEKLIELGGRRQALDPAQRAAVDLALQMELGRFPMDVFQRYTAALNRYIGVAHELYELAASVNVITQYANYELLARQLPEEAARLGIQI